MILNKKRYEILETQDIVLGSLWKESRIHSPETSALYVRPVWRAFQEIIILEYHDFSNFVTEDLLNLCDDINLHSTSQMNQSTAMHSSHTVSYAVNSNHQLYIIRDSVPLWRIFLRLLSHNPCVKNSM